MQQFYEGSLEVGEKAEWLSGVLTAHCELARDEQVYRMGDLISSLLTVAVTLDPKRPTS